MGGCLEVWCSHAGVDSKKQETLPHTGWTERTNTQGCTLNPTYVMACMHCPHTQTQKTEKNSMQRKKKKYNSKENESNSATLYRMDGFCTIESKRKIRGKHISSVVLLI